jgi:hypothetical protein
MCEVWVVGGGAGPCAAQARNERMVGGAPAPDASAAEGVSSPLQLRLVLKRPVGMTLHAPSSH